MELDFNHRLETYDQYNPDLLALVDSVSHASDRAEAVITLLEGYFLDDRCSMNDDAIYHVLESVRLDVVDIKKMVSHFHQAQKSPDK